MRLLVDTNIVIDHLRKRHPHADSARLLLALGKLGEFELWLSPTQMGDAFYLLTDGGKRTLSHQVHEELRELRKAVRICQYGEQEIDKALHLGWPDFEDALVYEAARAIKADAILTRNQEDFEKSTIPTFDCDEFFDWYASEHGIHYAELTLES